MKFHFVGLKCKTSEKDTQQTTSPPSSNFPSGVTTGIAVGVSVAVIIPLLILSVLGYRYRRNGRCVWPNICKREGLSITVDDELSNSTQCEMGSTNPAE